MRKSGIKNKPSGSRGKVIAAIAVALLCVFALFYAIFARMVTTTIEQPLEAVTGWIGKVEVDDHGGDYRTTVPPAE